MTTYNIITEKMAFGGDCIAKIDGKTVFVPYAIPGEELEVEITEEKRDYSIARIVNILKPSVHRVKPFCPLYTKCGGCNMQHIDEEFQTELRAQILRETFIHETEKYAKPEDIPQVEVIKGSSKNYRSRFQFHNGGLMEKQSNNILPLENCPCAVNEINDWLKNTPQSQRPSGRVHVFGSEKISAVNNITSAKQKIVIAHEKEISVPEQLNSKNAKNKKKKQKLPMKRFQGTILNEANSCTVNLKGKNITFDVQGFFQSNMEVLEKTIDTVMYNLGGENALDMYSGCGTFSVFLADRYKNVTLVEHNRDALVYAEQNMAGKKHESFGVSGEKFVLNHAETCRNQNGPFEAVIIDPPRSGMEKVVCQWLCASDIPVIRSISCDSATHARDAKFLIRSGYKLQKLYLLDFYPQTCHIESLAFFEKE